MIRHPFKYIFTGENIIGVYRNYFLFSKRAKIFVIARVLADISFITFGIIIHKSIYDTEYITELWYYYASNVFSILVILSSIYHTSNFKMLLQQFNNYCTYLPFDNIYLKNIDHKNKMLRLSCLCYNFIRITWHVVFYFCLDEPVSEGYFILYYVYEINLYITYWRVIFEFSVIYFLIYEMSEQINNINRSISEEINLEVKLKISDNQFCSIPTPMFDQWSGAYYAVARHVNLFNKVFGLQITIMGIIIIWFYIAILYVTATLSLEGKFTPLMQFTYLATLTEFLIALYILSRTAQRALNSADTLRRNLATLLILTLKCDKQYKATRDLLRLVSTHPIRMEAFGSINIDMTLLPTCIAFCTSYTVIALQYNNVV